MLILAVLHDAGIENVEQRWYTASKCSSLISFFFFIFIICIFIETNAQTFG